MSQIFISHAVPDRPLANDLRHTLTAQGFRVWSGPRTRPDGEPDPGVVSAIRSADHVLVLLTPNTAQDHRVLDEIRLASEQRDSNTLWQRLRGWAQGFLRSSPEKGEQRIIPLLYPGVMLSDLRDWFENIQVGLPVRVESGDLESILPMLLSSLGEPITPFLSGGANTLRVDELTLRLINPAHAADGSLTAIGTLLYQPANGNTLVESHAFPFRAPASPLPETMDWYLQRYPLWPVGRRYQRARAQEAALQDWGRALFQAGLTMEADRQRFAPWLEARHGQRRFTVEVDSDLPLGSDENSRQQAEQAATELLALPWELLHDGQQFMLQASPTVPIRRRLPISDSPSRGEPPVRVLYLAPRSEDQPMVGYRDTVLAMLDSDIVLNRLNPPTQIDLEQLLDDPGQVFPVLHLDGQVVLDQHQQPALLLESSNTAEQTTRFAVTTLLGRVQPALVVLQTHGDNQAAHQATRQLLAAGVGAVLLLTGGSRETARYFLPPFYRLLAQGARIGEAVLAGRRAISGNDTRPRLTSGAAWPQDWFIPLLYQNSSDIRLLGAPSQTPSDPLSPPAQQTLLGRDREFFTLERLLRTQSLVVLSGIGGMGKSTLAAAMAHWLNRTAGFRSARVDIREINAPEELLATIATQLALSALPASPEALGLLLAARATLVVLDHVDIWPGDPVSAPGELLALCQTVLANAPDSRFLLTARQAPAESPANLHLAAPALEDAIGLLTQAMVRLDLSPAANDPGDHLATVEALVAAASGHPQILSLIAPDVARDGINAVTESLLERRRQLATVYAQPDSVLHLAMAVDRLPPEQRKQLPGLAVFQHLLHRSVLARVLEIPETATLGLENALLQMGLAQRGEDILYLDPELPGFIKSQLPREELQALEQRWQDGMRSLAGQLLEGGIQLGKTAIRATLPPLLGLLDHLATQGDDGLLETGRRLRNLLGGTSDNLAAETHPLIPEATPEPTDQSRPEDQPEHPHEEEPDTSKPPPPANQASQPAQQTELTGEWNHRHFRTLRRKVEQFLSDGQFASARDNAQRLLARSLEASESDYPQAPMDLLAAYLTYGRALRVQGTPREALSPLQIAHQRAAERPETQRLLPALEAELGESRLALGDLQGAMRHYQNLTEQARQLDDLDGSLLGQLRLGAMQLSSGNPQEARETLENALQEAGHNHPHLADLQQLLSTIRRQQGDYDAAEQLNQQALEQCIRRQDRSGEAAALAEMSTLFDSMGRLEEAVRLASQTISIAMELEDQQLEGRARHNLGDTLMKLGRLPESRLALEQALDLKLEQGPAAEVWKTWHLLSRLDAMQGKPTAADARQQAVESFLAFRQAGGLNPHPAGQLCEAMLTMIQTHETDLQQLMPTSIGSMLNPTQGMGLLLEKLRGILAGERDPALAESQHLHYQYVAELRLLLEKLNTQAAALEHHQNGPSSEPG